jgi:hypothetical protein
MDDTHNTDAPELPRRIPCRPPRMDQATGPPGGWPVPKVPTPGRLAEWLGLSVAELDWFADVRGWNPVAPERLRHYTLRSLPRPSGSCRILEVPKRRLRTLQRRLLDGLLSHLPAHDVAHAYRPGRSVLTFAAPHAGRRLVLRLDLRDFFASVRASRVHALFRRVGYPRAVARLLTGLCTHSVPPGAWPAEVNADEATRRLFARRHLPQGAPTSPALANLCTWRLDTRLAALAASAGATFTRYADDLVFSGDRAFERSARRFHVRVLMIALDEGFEVRARKTLYLRRGVRQEVCGVVVNERPNVSREEYDRLKAILCNCVRHGPRSQNRGAVADFRAHLLGRVAWVEHVNPGRGVRLRRLWERIRWEGR